jgi:hypothetical protein
MHNETMRVRATTEHICFLPAALYVDGAAISTAIASSSEVAGAEVTVPSAIPSAFTFTVPTSCCGVLVADAGTLHVAVTAGAPAARLGGKAEKHVTVLLLTVNPTTMLVNFTFPVLLRTAVKITWPPAPQHVSRSRAKLQLQRLLLQTLNGNVQPVGWLSTRFAEQTFGCECALLC